MNTTLPSVNASAHLTVFRAKDAKYFAVFVEGADDVELWKPWLRYRPFPLGGCEPVIKAVRELSKANACGFAGILDADCDALEGTRTGTERLLITENHDIECDIAQTGMLNKIFDYVDESLLALWLTAKDLRTALSELLLPFGLLRWHFFRLKREFESKLSVYRFIDSKTARLDESALLAEAASILSVDEPLLRRELDVLKQRSAAVWRIVNGHDLIDVIRIVLSGPLDSSALYRNTPTMRNTMLLAMESAHIMSLSVWRQLANLDSAQGFSASK